MKKPLKGEVWINKKGYEFLVTDRAKKKSKEYRLYDDEWNNEAVGTWFIYSVNENDNCFTQSRVTENEFIIECKYFKKAQECYCPNCKTKYHHKFTKHVVGQE